MNEIKRLGHEIELHYESHGAPLKLTACEVVNRGEKFIFTAMPKKGTQVSKIFKRAFDINATLQLSLFQPFYEGQSIRIAVALRPIKDYSLLKMLRSSEFRNNNMRICVPLGYTMRNSMKFYDLASDSAPHTIDSGGSGSGKSEFLKCTVTSLALSKPVNKLNLIIIDCGGNSLEAFHSLPHLSFPIVKDTTTLLMVLKALVEEMEKRIRLSQEELREEPTLVIIWDEYNSTIKNITDVDERKELTSILEDLLRRCRKTKMHVILASQECNKADMMINLNNLNARIAFRCSDCYNSRAILGVGGAENLPGRGAMLFKSSDQTNPLFVQGAYISNSDIERVIAHINSATHDFSNKFVIQKFVDSPALTEISITTDKRSTNGKRKELAEIILWALQYSTISSSKIKEHFKMGNRADEAVDELFQIGIVSEKFANQPRVVLPKSINDISEDVIQLLSVNGYSSEDVIAAIEKRKD
jgi:S-DNA-T family DNA segregation ATPase FtsK/SpoIIIE